MRIQIKIFEKAILNVVITDEIDQSDDQFKCNQDIIQYKDQPHKPQKRFRISDHEAVEWHQLKNQTENLLFQDDLESNKIQFSIQDGIDVVTFKIQLSPFRIQLLVNEQLLNEVNSHDLLYYENKHIEEHNKLPQFYKQLDTIIEPFLSSFEQGLRDELFTREIEQTNPHYDFRESIGLSFTMHSQYLFGLPERADSPLLESTENGEPYRLYNLDVPEHGPYNKQPLYGSVPYLTSHSDKFDSSIVWMNSAETFVDIFDSNSEQEDKDNQKKLISFVSESGVLEFFLFGNSIQNGGPKIIMQKLALITGFAPLPPYFSLGFHYSKQRHLTTETLIEEVEKLNQNNMPIDTIWLDIEYADEKRQFAFDDSRLGDIGRFSDLMSNQDKRIVVITNPHIKKDNMYFAYREGNEIKVGEDHHGGEIQGVWVRDKNMWVFFGDSVSGKSVWIDFLNDKSCLFWRSLYQFDKFQGTNKFFNFWMSMNEPSVFNEFEQTLPKDTVHIDKDNNYYYHKDLHNAYGIMGAQQSYLAQIERINDQNQRPFLLSRSVFFGSQKYGAMWTGENQAQMDFIPLSIQMCISLSISGIPFCGADIGGFKGYQQQNHYAKWFQNAIFQPFYRANSHSSVKDKQLQDQMYMTEVIRNAIFTRQSLIPYIYATFYNTTLTGVPLMRPMWMEYPQELDLIQKDLQYMFGDSLLIGVTYPDIERQQINKNNNIRCEIQFPVKDDFYEINKGNKVEKKLNEPQTIELGIKDLCAFVKAGSIIPLRQKGRMSAIKSMRDGYTLDIYPRFKDGTAQGFIYQDDGESFNHKSKKEYNLVEFKMNADKSIELIKHHIGYTQDQKNSKFEIQSIIMNDFKQYPQQLMVKSKDSTGSSYIMIDKHQMAILPNTNRLIIKNLNIDLLEVEGGHEPVIIFIF